MDHLVRNYIFEFLEKAKDAKLINMMTAAPLIHHNFGISMEESRELFGEWWKRMPQHPTKEEIEQEYLCTFSDIEAEQ